ncbi:MAG: BLUF domain-containing protein [Comamonas sp.]|jgi:hypothetical protein|nr:BLUF domain-containing protein [Comamonas sp.]
MSSNTGLHAFLYCSSICPEQPVTVVGDIVKAAREKNTALSLTGILVFDGQHFCQYLEGPSSSVSSMLQSICEDHRHTDVMLQFHGPVDGERQFKGWAIAYAQSEQELALDKIANFEGREALALFRQLLPNLDYC